MPEQNNDLRPYEAARARADHPAALEEAQRLLETAESRHREALLRVAREHALVGRHEQALMTLWEAIDAGFWDAARLRDDEGFAAFRGEEAFQAIVRAARWR